MDIQYLRALHVISMVAWFSGLFFLGRMMVYFSQAQSKPEAEKNAITELVTGAQKRVLYIITMPAMTLTIIFGSMLMTKTGALREGWFHLKLLFVILFVFYNIYIFKLRKAMIQHKATPSTLKLRLLNEGPFIFLIIIVFTVFLKNFFSGLWAGTVLVIAILILAVITRLMFKKKNK